jgi:glycosyltransferase involved in cell wall biosynthesis
MQKHRRFDVLLRAFAEAMAQEPTLRALFLGRGTHVDTVVRQPALALGLAEKVILPGYRADDYADYLAAIDFKIFLVPGSEGSCRAAREAMALGIPVLASRRGLLPDLVEDGRCGLVIDDTHENLVKAILRLARDKALRERLGRNAAQKAREHFNMDDQAEAIAGLYARLAERL